MNRTHIYYWKCDRASGFRALQSGPSPEESTAIALQLQPLLTRRLNTNNLQLRPGKGQGNHLTFLAAFDEKTFFIRLENGPEKDNYMLVEQLVVAAVRKLGVPTVIIYETDASRSVVDFAFQVMQYLEYPDLNKLYKAKELDIAAIAFEIGRYIAQWQHITPPGFGPFNTEKVLNEGQLEGLHSDYPAYFFLNLQKHLDFLIGANFLTGVQAQEILHMIDWHKDHLELEQGCLVHKDMALWNLLGIENEIKAVIDWDDAVSGDPTDDLSLLACFHGQEVVEAALRGYTTVRQLPEAFDIRFHLHLLRNMIVKAVIRVGANYFQKKDDFFLIDSGEEGSSLEQFTRDRIFDAVEMLKRKIPQQIL